MQSTESRAIPALSADKAGLSRAGVAAVRGRRSAELGLRITRFAFTHPTARVRISLVPPAEKQAVAWRQVAVIIMQSNRAEQLRRDAAMRTAYPCFLMRHRDRLVDLFLSPTRPYRYDFSNRKRRRQQ